MSYGAEFSKTAIFGAYDEMIDDNATVVAREHTEATHKTKRADRGTYKTPRQETAQFILAVVKDTWLREL